MTEQPDGTTSRNHLTDKVIVITGGAGGFGRLVAAKTAARGARVVVADIDEAGVGAVVDEIITAGGTATGSVADVRDLAAMRALADHAVEHHGAIDVMINNAGIMPLAFYADHEQAADAWDRCIDINIKGVLNGTIAVYDQMIAQGRGHVVNLSSIYGNFPVAGAAVYGATKAAVNVLSDALRVESQGRIKVTTVRPTGVPGTGLGDGIVNPQAISGILGGNQDEFAAAIGEVMSGTDTGGRTDPDDIGYWAISPDELADQIVMVIDQPWGLVISDLTVRAAGEHYVI
ncbi:MAG: SDR family oxidoreductase [Acidimicrobiales bacterium]